MQELVLMLPSAFRNPEKIAARIVYEGGTFVTPEFRATPSRLCADFGWGGDHQDVLEVFRLDECPADEDTFPEEEQALVKSLGEMLYSYLGAAEPSSRVDGWRESLQATSDFVGTFMPDGRMLYINVAGRRMLGRPADDITGLNLADCFRNGSARCLPGRLPAATRGGIWLGETPCCAAMAGNPRFAGGHRPQDENGAVNFVSSIRDIGERIELESRLTQSRDFHLKLFQSFPHMIWRSVTDGMCDYFNKAWLDFTGRKLEQELGDGWAEGVHPDDLDRCFKVYFEAISRHEPFEIEYRLRRHDGEYRWIMDIAAPYEDLNGDFAGFIGTCDDITERKRQENLALGPRHRISVNAILITDAQVAGNPPIYVNPAFERITGYSQEEALGRNCNFAAKGPASRYRALQAISSNAKGMRCCEITARMAACSGTIC
jgi:PAS domain S-box-containing protein